MIGLHLPKRGERRGRELRSASAYVPTYFWHLLKPTFSTAAVRQRPAGDVPPMRMSHVSSDVYHPRCTVVVVRMSWLDA